jgi:hypothetical protein
MVSFNSSIAPYVLDNHISVKDAAGSSSYSLQYLRRLLRCGKLNVLKIGQVWLIDKATFDVCLEDASKATDRRFGPQ